MPRLSKSDLLEMFEESIVGSDLSFLRISDEGVHPAAYQIIKGAKSFRLKVYIWNLTPGGNRRPLDEWRIQPTGLPATGNIVRFLPELDGKTAILGWNERYDVFAAFDVNKHLGPLGASPSIQLRENSLQQARLNGIACHFKGSEEIAFAVKPTYLSVYLENMESLHACGSSQQALVLLEAICNDPKSVDDRDIEQRVAAPRRFAIVSARKALRDANFSERVLAAYSNSCAMCGAQMRLLDAAHILPAAHPDSTDDTSNGIALCALHHRAYDRSLVTFDTGYRIHRNDEMERKLTESGVDRGLEAFRTQLFPTIAVPPSRDDRPSPELVAKVNILRGWHLS